MSAPVISLSLICREMNGGSTVFEYSDIHSRLLVLNMFRFCDMNFLHCDIVQDMDALFHHL